MASGSGCWLFEKYSKRAEPHKIKSVCPSIEYVLGSERGLFWVMMKCLHVYDDVVVEVILTLQSAQVNNWEVARGDSGAIRVALSASR